ncbi:MAG TPA: hypothetical protein HA345_02960 [Candidatus Thalassarchaeaceae archaeon]|nr:MAG TPA: hypothetical protein D7H94_02950 [Candidatus Poseidoniales archaeon]HIH84349.1 hypothetical protein [Candidatus Thalassarchaeaceae archaeon]|tara:strand:- start:422 stop:1087 length:666 start_codon:yes stop_codon:yes gene_type:complete
MLGLHALSAPSETVLHSEVLLVGLALMVLLNAGPASRNMRGIVISAALISVLVVSRVLLEPLPNIQPVTVALLLIGATLGVRRGIGIAILVTLLSNAFLGTGIWTFFQAMGWSFVAWTGAMASNHLTNGEGELDMRNLVYFSIGAAIVFDLIVSMAALVADPSPSVFVTYLIVGIPYDLLHVAGNVAFAAWLGPVLHRILIRSRDSDVTISGSRLPESYTQ